MIQWFIEPSAAGGEQCAHHVPMIKRCIDHHFIDEQIDDQILRSSINR
jgi:hypothetical protein